MRLLLAMTIAAVIMVRHAVPYLRPAAQPQRANAAAAAAYATFAPSEAPSP